jgi:hypothetical protein
MERCARSGVFLFSGPTKRRLSMNSRFPFSNFRLLVLVLLLGMPFLMAASPMQAGPVGTDLGATLEPLFAALFLSVVANRLIEALKAPIIQKYPNLDLWWLIYVSWVVGAALAWLAQINLFALLIPNLDPLAGRILSAIVIGGGSNLINDIFSKASPAVMTTIIPTTDRPVPAGQYERIAKEISRGLKR